MLGRAQRAASWRRINKAWLAWSAAGTVGLVVLVVIVQLLYPPGRLLPFVKINGGNYGGQTTWRAAEALESEYKRATFTVHAGKKTFTQTFAQVGLDVRATPTATEAGKYPLRQRLIPFSALFIMARRDTGLEMRTDNVRVQYFAEQIEKESSVPAVNAAIRITDGKVQIIPAQPSQDFPAQSIYKQLLLAPLEPTVTVTARPVSKQPAVSNAAVQEVLATAQRIIDTPLVLRVGDTDVTVDKSTIASWLDFPVTDSKMELSVKTDNIKGYVTAVQPQGYRAPTSTRITVVDGRETARLIGAAGRGVDIDAATQQIAQHIRAAKAEPLTLPTVALGAGTTYDRQYTGSSAGLFAYLSDLVASKGDYGIAVIELGGTKRAASANGDRVYGAASTYKIYTAYAIFQLIASGEMKWDEQIGGLRADACFEAMIVHSDNECAWAFGDRIGWQRIQDMMRAQGLASTTLSSSGKYTTANDLALFLRKLEEGSLLPASSRDMLLGYMRRQVYRNGIPAATGVAVANKVGGAGAFVHDAGIVYAPGRTYVMVIMTRGSSWPGLTAAARQVHSFVMH